MVVGTRVLSLGLLATAIINVGQGAIAQEAAEPLPDPLEVETLPEAFLDAFYSNAGTFFENNRFPATFTWITGPYPDNQITSDGDEVDEVYHYALYQQNQSDPYMRTADLPNPFTSSLLLTPIYEAEAYEVVTPPPIFYPQEVRPVPVPQPVQPDRPVPALY